jgi:hypothetical protein
MRLLPLTESGAFARGLEDGRQAALELHRRVSARGRFVGTRWAPELDIVVWAVRGETLAESSARAQAVFDEAAKLDLHLALARLPVELFPAGSWAAGQGSDTLLCLRSVMMKPEHLDWVEAIWSRLCEATRIVVETRVLCD